MKWTTHKPSAAHDRWISLQMTEADARAILAELAQLPDPHAPVLTTIRDRLRAWVERPDDRELARRAR